MNLPSEQLAHVRFLNVLRAVERMPLPDLVMHQARRIETLVRHARKYVPFYGDRLAPLFTQGDVLDLARWSELPLLTPDIARGSIDAMTAAAVPEFAGGVSRDQTSGTGGDALHFYRSEAAIIADGANSLRIFLDHGFDTDARFADLRIDINRKAQYPEGALRPNWSFGAGRGDYVILDILTPVSDQVEWLLRMRPKILFTWATNAREIALKLEQLGEVLPLSSLATSAEICSEGVKKDCERVFGTSPIDILGAREVGIMAWRCHAGQHYHLVAESVYCEVIRDDGSPAGPGEEGRLVATSFYNFHTPFIRYATGDYLRLGASPCPCGRSLPVVEAVLGRERNRYRSPDGRARFPNVPEAALDRLIGPLAWRIVQPAPGRLEVHVEDAVFTSLGDRQAIAQCVRLAFGCADEVDMLARPLMPSGRKKREMFRSSVPDS